MSNRNHDFENRVPEVPSLVQYLSRHRCSISGPRTLEQAYAAYRRRLMTGTFRLPDHVRERVRRLDPNKVNWPDAYEWWHRHKDAAP